MCAENNELRIAVVGLGVGKAHIKQFSDLPGVSVVAVCDQDEKRLTTLAEEYDIEQTYSDFDEMLHSASLDAVAVATPNYTHCALTLKAFQAGLHVLCEKPLAVDAAEAAEMVEAAENAGLKLAVHYNHRMAPGAQLVQRYIENGDFGDIYYVRSIWHRWQGIPGGASGWFYKADLAGGGCFIDLGVHMIDRALTFAGFPRVLSVSGQLHNKFGEVDLPGEEMDVDDFGTAYIRCENGLTIAVEISWASHAPRTGMCTEVYGTEGGAVIDENGVEIMHREHGQLAKTVFPSGVNDTGMPTVHSDFAAAIREDREPLCSGREGLLLMRILDAVKQSSQSGHEVSFEA